MALAAAYYIITPKFCKRFSCSEDRLQDLGMNINRENKKYSLKALKFQVE